MEWGDRPSYGYIHMGVCAYSPLQDARSLQPSSLGNRSYCENLGMSDQLTLLFPPDFRRSCSKRARLSLQGDEVQVTRKADENFTLALVLCLSLCSFIYI